MGLDNIPNQYPCKTQGTAVLKDGQIDCAETQENGGCPYVKELDKITQTYNEDKTLFGSPVYGMFGTDCWYRGKWGNHLLEALGYGGDSEYSFYGDNIHQTEKSPESCLELARIIDDSIYDIERDNAERDEANIIRIDGQDITADLRYASWYLKWASEHTNGLICWY